MINSLSGLDRLEAEAITILRQVLADFQRPLLLYSVGKDSSVLLHLAKKAFAPMPCPFALLHIDTGWKFTAMIALRDEEVARSGLTLHIARNREAEKANITPLSQSASLYTDQMKTQPLRQFLSSYGCDAAIGGARRDEEASRAKERIFSWRDAGHHWNPRQQRPELGYLFNNDLGAGESMRVFPLSNWTELDIWHYIRREEIPIVPLYFAANHPVIYRQQQWIMQDDQRLQPQDGERVEIRKVRFRTLGCYPLTAAIESEADTIEAIIEELLTTQFSERQGRLIDHDELAAMERKKLQGYF